ncbi:MAG TPA: DNA ligase, partial [Ideonella sp.]|nr:DNA ligase [Ideonella sp.]
EADARIDPRPYLVSEKYDGVRAFWDGRQLRLRGGGAVKAPGWFTAPLPPQPLDGELWLARGRFDALSAIVRKEAPVDGDWRQLKYMVFELPGAAGSFAERAERLRALAARSAEGPLVAVEQQRLADRAALQRRLDEVVRAGGEGLVLHRADAPYSTGRSDVLLKLKPVQDDEAVVIGHQPGKGKYAGQLGALTVRSTEGRVFQIGSGLSDAQRADPPPLGATVTYRYRGLTPQGLPRFASLLRLREPGL